jgi:hypothetical protein
MVYDTLPTLAADRPVVSTVRILDPLTGEPHPLWVPLRDYRDLMAAEHCDVLLDEVTGVASSRESAGMPAAVANLLVQLRRRDVALRWTAPSWKRADTIIRETSQAVTLCMGFAPETVVDPVVGERQWRSRTVFLWRTYDTATFDEWTAHRRERMRPTARQIFYRPGSLASAAYDTFDQVLSLGAVTDAGTCMECGGHRQRLGCKCADYLDARKKPSPLDQLTASPEPGRRRRLTVLSETDETPSVAFDAVAHEH